MVYKSGYSDNDIYHAFYGKDETIEEQHMARERKIATALAEKDINNSLYSKEFMGMFTDNLPIDGIVRAYEAYNLYSGGRHYGKMAAVINGPLQNMINRCFEIKNVIFNDPATIVFWADGSKTVVKAENEPFDPEKGLAMAFFKKVRGNTGRYFNEFKKWCPEVEKEDSINGMALRDIANILFANGCCTNIKSEEQE